MRRRVISLSVAVALAAVACGVSEDGAVRRIDQVPFELGDTIPPTTTSSTTTTTLPTSTSEQAASTTIATELVRLYFIASGQLTSVSIALPSPAALPQVVSALQAGPPAGELGTGLRSAVPKPVEISVSDDGAGVATVDLPPGFFDNIATTDQRLVVAQIVLTLAVRPGIGQVTFSQAGRPLSVPLGSGQLSEPGQLLSRRNYETLLNPSGSPVSQTTLSTVPPQP